MIRTTSGQDLVTTEYQEQEEGISHLFIHFYIRCSATCNLNPGYDCQGGDPVHADDCFDKCGDGLRVPITGWACDDGNLIGNDGCSSICTINNGYTCAGGSLTSMDICTEICADGLAMG
jgi:cysteine-rich repeat protein